MAELPNPCLLEGAGNRILVWDARAGGRPPAFALPRRARPSYDQLVLLEGDGAGALHARIRNADGSEAEQCGNGMRCLGLLPRPPRRLAARRAAPRAPADRRGDPGARRAGRLPRGPPRAPLRPRGRRLPRAVARPHPIPPPIEAGYLPLPDGTGLGREAG
ncbi:MAG: hypothetical protein RML12_10290 [Xanthomonadales bacterium]|nr:hypothetical protein [Xanthomonadales bacterium]